jgi:hypothetical protein
MGLTPVPSPSKMERGTWYGVLPLAISDGEGRFLPEKEVRRVDRTGG